MHFQVRKSVWNPDHGAEKRDSRCDASFSHFPSSSFPLPRPRTSPEALTQVNTGHRGVLCRPCRTRHALILGTFCNRADRTHRAVASAQANASKTFWPYASQVWAKWGYFVRQAWQPRNTNSPLRTSCAVKQSRHTIPQKLLGPLLPSSASHTPPTAGRVPDATPSHATFHDAGSGVAAETAPARVNGVTRQLWHV